MQDHRRYTRWRAEGEIKLKLDGAETFFSCSIEDINFMGIGISSAMKLPQDTFLKVTLALTDDFVFEVEAWVAWYKAKEGRYYYGLYFSRINDSDKEKIYQFMRRYFPAEMNKQWWQGLNTQKESDKRIFARFPVNVPVRFIGEKENKEVVAETVDVSAKGVGIITEENLAPHSTVEAWLDVPDGAEPLYARAEVVWSKPLENGKYRCGLNLEKADLMGLSRILRAA